MVKDKLLQLRSLFSEFKINGYIISTTDEYLSEYSPACGKRLEYLTNFSGSNAIAIILTKTVLFFTDGRYTEQSSKELDKDLFQIFDQTSLARFPWKNFIAKNDIIAYDPAIFNKKFLQLFKTLKLAPQQKNLIDKIWHNKPKEPNSLIYNYDISFAGLGREQKFAKCRKFLKKHNAGTLAVNSPEILCWLFNIRASDTEFAPLILARGLITEEKAYLFTDAKINTALSDVTVLPKEFFEKTIKEQKSKILFDDNLCSKHISNLIQQKNHEIIVDPCILWKSCKNSVEIDHMIKGHITDAVAVIEFLTFLKNNNLSNYSEYDLGKKLTELRSKGVNYVSDSFPAIIGFQENGAIIHYRALPRSAKKIAGDGLLLIDSGGQYLGATTDITRVAPIGSPQDEHKYYYTKILKGHLSLAMVKFPKETATGANLDVLARQFLWQNGHDYPHSTGHGVGSFLNVHEGPQSISLRDNNIKFDVGMVVSNEPGFYLPGKFGIRIENMMYVRESNKNGFLEFAPLSLVPYEKQLIDWSMITYDEQKYLLHYYQLIEKKIMPYLSKPAKKWLQDQHNI